MIFNYWRRTARETIRSPAPSVGLLVLCCFSLSFIQAGEDEYERIKPREPEREERERKLPDPDAQVPGDPAVLVESLKAVILLGTNDNVGKPPQNAVGIDTKRVPLLDTSAFKQRLGAFLGKPVSMQSLNRMVRATLLYHREADRPLVDVVVPEQDITGGIVQLIVIEGKVGQVKVEGGRWFSDKNIRRDVRTKAGDIVRTSRLLRELDRLNQNPYRNINVLFTPGIEKGLTDVIFQVKDRFPARFYGGYEDTGTRLTGRDRVLGGFNWGNAFFQDHQLGYQFTTDITKERFRGHSGYYRATLPLVGHSVLAFGSHSSTNARLNEDFDISGTSWQIGLRYRAELPDFGVYRHYAEVGFDFKRSNNDLAFGGERVFRSGTDVAQFALEYGGSASDVLGATRFSITGFFSPGGMTENQRPRSYRAARAFSDAQYAYGTLAIERAWKLPFKDWTVATRFTGQLSDENLLGSEQLGFGGHTTIRGYEEREYNADQGLIANVELRSPRYRLGKIGSNDSLTHDMQFLAFYDYGLARNHRLLDEEVTPDFASTGLGARYNMGKHIALRFDYGWRLERGFSKNDGGRMHLGVVISY